METSYAPLITAIWNFAITFLGPMIAFIGGVFIANKLKLYEKLEGRNAALMSIPVGLVVLGTLITSVGVSLPNGNEVIVLYGYCQSFDKYLVFCGTTMFLGTTAPDLFGLYRKSLTAS